MSDYHPGTVRRSTDPLGNQMLMVYPITVEPCLECGNYVGYIAVHLVTWMLIGICSLTGLLSFMLSEEITAGGMQASDYDRRLYAKRSHAWNTQQKVFRTAFPEVRPFTTYHYMLAHLSHQYSEEQMKDLPNMGEKERGVSDTAPKPVTTPPTSPLNETELSRHTRRETVKAHQQGTGDGVHTWASTLRRIVLEKWRWGAFLVIAIVVSRYST